MSFDRFPRAKQKLDEALREGVAPGFVAGVWLNREPEIVHLHAAGVRRRGGKGLSELPMEIDTVFDLASISKVFGTATLAAHLVERGWIRYETRLKSILPEFASEEITLGQLLSHTAGLPAWAPLYEWMKERFGKDALPWIPIRERQAQMREFVLGISPERPPGEVAVYSDLCFLLMGFALEEILQLPLDEAVRRHVWEPLGLLEADQRGPYYQRITAPAFQFRNETVAATEECPWRHTVLQGQVHDDNCWSMGGYGGHAGAFGTARNLLRFSKGLQQGSYLSQDVLRRMWKRVGRPVGCDRTLGWDTPSGETPAFGRIFSRHSVGHLGFTGTSLWVDLDRGLTVVLLSNRVHPSRTNEKIKAFRAVFHDALATDLGLNPQPEATGQ